MKQCSSCGEAKEHSCFYTRKESLDGYHGRCKACINMGNNRRYHENREVRLSRQRANQRTYTAKKLGLTSEQLAAMYDRAKGCCEICGISEEEHGKALAIDHCHDSGEVRGLLCMQCNTALGNFNDDLVRIKKAMEYLT